MRRLSSLIISSFLIYSCSNSNETSTDLDFDYDYEIWTYNGDTTDNENLSHIEYYDNGGKIVRKMGKESCTRFLYDSSGRLTETLWGRNCSYDLREIMLYDSSYNLLGVYQTRDSLVNLDTVKYRQIYFYDTSGNIIKELDHEWSDYEGKRHVQWNFYSYENGKRAKERNVQDDEGVLWTGMYRYDSNSNLESIHKVRNETFWTKTFQYDSADQLIAEEIESNEYPLIEDVSFSASNNKTLYKYHPDGYLVEKKTLSHKGKVNSRTLYVRKRKK